MKLGICVFLVAIALVSCGGDDNKNNDEKSIAFYSIQNNSNYDVYLSYELNAIAQTKNGETSENHLNIIHPGHGVQMFEVSPQESPDKIFKAFELYIVYDMNKKIIYSSEKATVPWNLIRVGKLNQSYRLEIYDSQIPFD